MVGYLPKSVDVNGRRYKIRTDFRDILKIVIAFNDPELEDNEKVFVCLYIFYKDFEDMPQSDYEAAFSKALAFIDCDTKDGDNLTERPRSPRTMDWEQDEAIIFPAINKIAGFETRSAKYIHWWTFIGYYLEISEGIFASVLNVRMKKNKGKKLEKWEREFWSANKDICKLKPKLSAKEQAEKDRLNALLG